MRKIFHTLPNYPSRTPYTPAIEIVNNDIRTLYVSGQGTRNPTSGKKYSGEDIQKQMLFAMTNLKSIIEESKFSMQDIIKTTLFITNIDKLDSINAIYVSFFNRKHLPTRSTIMVAALPGGMAVEIEAIAIKEETEKL